MQRALPLKRLLCGGLSCWHCEMSGGLIRHSRNLARTGDKTYGDANDIRFSGGYAENRVCKRLAAHWISSYPVAEFKFIRSDKLSLPD